MPAISLVICLRGERELLARLLEHAAGCYDDLVVVHDGPEFDDGTPPPPVTAPPAEMAMDYAGLAANAPIPPFYTTPPLPARSGSIHELVALHGGCYFEGPRCYQQEPHWPFAWSRAKHDWILRLDADEFSSKGLKDWLKEFRDTAAEPNLDYSGYTCIWPLWDGRKAVTTEWPAGRRFLVHKQQIHFFGVVEATPIPDGHLESLRLALHHEPLRKSYGIRNVVFRKQAYRWRKVIAQSLMGPPTSLPCWRWSSPEWPASWESMRRHPLITGFKGFFFGPLWQARDMWKHDERKLSLSALIGTGLHLLLMRITFWIYKCRFRRMFKP